MDVQRQHTDIFISDEIAFAQLRRLDFKQLADAVDGSAPHEVHEKLVWELASCLFDGVEYPKQKGKDNGDYILNRVRKDQLSAFWGRLVQDAAMQQVYKAGSKEEEAIAYLSANQVEDACASLLSGRDYRLATLVSMIGGDSQMRRDIKEQLDEWRRMKVLSEISEPIRAIYELLAGNTCVSEGCKGPLEDRARSFVISERFGFGWKQAFGLRLWYGIREEQPLMVAVQKFLDDLEAHKEDHARPVPWFVEQRVSVPWEDPHKDEREDLLWGILRLYTNHMDGIKNRKEGRKISLEDVILPQNHQISPVDFRLAWQLYHNFQWYELGGTKPDHVGNEGEDEMSLKITQLTLDYASQLENAGEWVWAIFVMLHLKNTERRARGVLSLLARHGGAIGDGVQDETFKTLLGDFRLPREWVYEAKALYARSVRQDHVAETEYLLSAWNFEAAHETLVQKVAPQAVIENDTTMLQRLLDRFSHTNLLEHWTTGGQVYVDYLRLLKLVHEQGTDADKEESESRKTEVMHNGSGSVTHNDLAAVVLRLLSALPTMTKKDRKLGFVERVAVQEMSDVVAKVCLERYDELEEVSFCCAPFLLLFF